MTGAVTVIGAGSWGTALAILLARNGIPTLLWGRDEAAMAQMALTRENRRYLPGAQFPANLTPTADLPSALCQTTELLLSVPSHAFRHTLAATRPYLSPAVPVAWATKGLEPDSLKLLHEVAAELLSPQWPVAVISGPTFAKEVAQGLPTAVTVASPEMAVAERVAARLHGGTFRAYTSTDIIGVELGGAIKNVLAIAAGIADGLGFGANTRAALITRGLAELMRLGQACGGRAETFMGLAGLGDLILTCTDDQSRNRRAGLALGHGKGVEQALASIDQVVEGIGTAQTVHRLAQREGVEMPIAEQVYRVIYHHLSPSEAVQTLFAREQKPEIG